MRGSVLWITADNSWNEAALAAAFGTAWLRELGVPASVQPVRPGLGPAIAGPPGVSVAAPLLAERRRGFRRPKLVFPGPSDLGRVVVDQSVQDAFGFDVTWPAGAASALFLRTVPEPDFDYGVLSAYDAVWAANRPVWDAVRSSHAVPESRLWLVPPPHLGTARMNPRPGSGILVAAGVLDVVKGLDMVFNALTVLRDRGQIWQLLVLGDGPERGRWTVYARALGLDVRFEPADWDWDSAISGADIFIAPQFRDGLGWDVAAAARVGTPVVMADLPTLRDPVRHAADAVILPETRAADLVEALERLAGNRTARQQPAPSDQAVSVWREMLA